MSATVTALSSKATAAVLLALADRQQQHAPQAGGGVQIESVGGVDAERRVAAGEVFDAVLLAGAAIDRLIGGGHLQPPRVDLLRSAMVAAVPAAAPPRCLPLLADEAGLQQWVRGARRIGYSTGPSGDHLLRLLERWGLNAEVGSRLLQAPPGVPVAQLLARGDVDLGFQQHSELARQPGVTVLGPLPGSAALVTVFAAARHAASTQAAAVEAWLQFIRSPAALATIRLHGMEPA